MITISVIMLTYNRKSYMQQMIQDVLHQDYQGFEFLVIDNGCNDGSEVILDRIGQQDPRMRVIHLPEQSSIGRARNIGLQNAAGEFIAYVDDDDRVEADFLSFLVALQRKCNADVAMCGADEEQNGKIGPQCMYDEEYILSGEEAVMELLKRKKIRAGTPTKLFRRAILEEFPFNEKALSEDIHTMYKYLAEAKQVILHGIPKYHFIRHGENNSFFTSDISKLTPEMLGEYLDAYRERAAYLGTKYPAKQEFFDYTAWSFMISMCEKIKKNHVQACASLCRAMQKNLQENQDKILNCRYISLEEWEALKKIVNK